MAERTGWHVHRMNVSTAGAWMLAPNRDDDPRCTWAATDRIPVAPPEEGASAARSREWHWRVTGWRADLVALVAFGVPVLLIFAAGFWAGRAS